MRAQAIFTGIAANRSFGSQSIGTQSAPRTLSFTVSANTTVGSIAVLTMGEPNLDFTSAAASTCSAQGNVPATQCTVQVEFAPTAVGLRMGAVVFYSQPDNTGSVLASVPIYGTGSGPQIGFGPGTATAIDPKVNGCFLLEPVAMAFDGAGGLFIAEMYGVVKLPANGGAATAIYPMVNGEGLDYPSGLAVDGAGNLFIADFEHNRVVEVPAGGGAAIAIDPTVKGKSLNGPYGLAVDAMGDLFIADSLNWRVVEVPAGGAAAIAIDPVANGAGLVNPQGVAVDGAGDLFIADTVERRVVEVPAGGGAAIAIDPTVNGIAPAYIYGVGVDAAGNLFIADTDRGRVVEVPAGGGTPIAIDPLVNGKGLGGPTTVSVNSAGDLFIVDTFNNRIVQLKRSQPPALGFTYPTGLGTTDTADGVQTVQISNIGNEPLTLASIGFPIDFLPASGDAKECAGTIALNVGQACDVPVEFAPRQSGALSENFTFTDNTMNGTGAQQSIVASGTGVVLAAFASPTPGASLPGTTVNFSWTAGTGASGYKLWLGSTGTGSNNLYNSGVKTATTVVVKGLPLNGETIYARLFSNFGGTLEYSDSTYSATAPAVIASPAPGSTLAGASATFAWPTTSGATDFSLVLGSTGVGSNDLWSSSATTGTSVTSGALPVNGETIYARPHTNFSGIWAYTDSTFTAATVVLATITAPAPGSTLAGASVTFTWTPGVAVTNYQLLVGTTGAGSSSIYNSGSIVATCATVPKLPVTGVKVYVRLLSESAGAWKYNDYTYIAK